MSSLVRRWIGPSVALLMALAVAWPSVPHARATREPLVVIVSERTGIRAISRAELRRCFLGMTVTLAGVRLIPFNHPRDSHQRERFDQSILGMSKVASQRYWIDNLIRGGKGAPRTVASGRLLAKLVAKLPGAISYVKASSVSGVAGLSAVAVDGNLPDGPDYPLR